MKIGLVSSAVPLAYGGYRFIVEWLEAELHARGHLVETIYLPSTEDPDTVLQQMTAFAAIDFARYYDRIITFRPPAHLVRHPCKVVWFLHHFRAFYDLWNSRYCPFPDTLFWRAVRDQLVSADTGALSGAHRVFSNSAVVADRLQRFNGVRADILYPPVHAPERFRAGAYGDEIVCICRLEHHKRQHLLIEAMAHTTSGVRLRLCGSGLDPAYTASLHEMCRQGNLDDRVAVEGRWIAEDEKASLLETALAAAYVPVDEDSYGYPTIEAAHASRGMVTLGDSGGVLEFVIDGVNGMVVPPDPAAIAGVFDRLYNDRELARRLGGAASEHVAAMGIDWDTVVAKLLA